MTTTDQTPADRMADRCATLSLSAAGRVELFAALEDARSRVRKPVSEDPNTTLLAGWDLHERVLEHIDSSRRGQVAPVAREWLLDALALSANDWNHIVVPHRRLAQAAKDEQLARRQSGPRAGLGAPGGSR